MKLVKFEDGTYGVKVSVWKVFKMYFTFEPHFYNLRGYCGMYGLEHPNCRGTKEEALARLPQKPLSIKYTVVKKEDC